MKTAFIAFVAMVSAIAPNGALAHGNHSHRQHFGPHLYVRPLPPAREQWAKHDCHWHPNKGFWHCHRRLRSHGETIKGNHPNFGVHFIIPIQ